MICMGAQPRTKRKSCTSSNRRPATQVLPCCTAENPTSAPGRIEPGAARHGAPGQARYPRLPRLRATARERLDVDSMIFEAQLAYAKRGGAQKAYDRPGFNPQRIDLINPRCLPRLRLVLFLPAHKPRLRDRSKRNRAIAPKAAALSCHPALTYLQISQVSSSHPGSGPLRK